MGRGPVTELDLEAFLPVVIVAEMTTGTPGARVTQRLELGRVTLDPTEGLAKAFRQIPEVLRDLADSWDAAAAMELEDTEG